MPFSSNTDYFQYFENIFFVYERFRIGDFCPTEGHNYFRSERHRLFRKGKTSVSKKQSKIPVAATGGLVD